jgi:hypothetical protein
MKPYLRKKIPSAQTKRGAGGVARGVQLEFKPQHGNKKKKKTPPKSLQSCFLHIFDPWWIIFPSFIGFIRKKSPVAALLPSHLNVLVFLELLGTGGPGLVPETVPLISGTPTLPPQGLGCWGQNLQHEKISHFGDFYKVWD